MIYSRLQGVDIGEVGSKQRFKYGQDRYIDCVGSLA